MSRSPISVRSPVTPLRWRDDFLGHPNLSSQKDDVDLEEAKVLLCGGCWTKIIIKRFLKGRKDIGDALEAAALRERCAKRTDGNRGAMHWQ